MDEGPRSGWDELVFDDSAFEEREAYRTSQCRNWHGRGDLAAISSRSTTLRDSRVTLSSGVIHNICPNDRNVTSRARGMWVLQRWLILVIASLSKYGLDHAYSTSRRASILETPYSIVLTLCDANLSNAMEFLHWCIADFSPVAFENFGLFNFWRLQTSTAI